MAVIKTDAVSITIKNQAGDKFDLHPDLLAIMPTLEAKPVYELVRNTSITRTSKLSFEYKVRLKTAFRKLVLDGGANDERDRTKEKYPVLLVQAFTLTENEMNIYKEDIFAVDTATEAFKGYVEQATVAIIAQIRDAKDGDMFAAIDAAATATDANGYVQIDPATGASALAALPAGAIARQHVKAYTATAADAQILITDIHKRANALVQIGSKGNVEQNFALATYGNVKSNIVILVEMNLIDIIQLVPNILQAPKAYQDMFIDGEINIFKGYMMITAARVPATWNYCVITTGIRGTVGLMENATLDQLMSVIPHPTNPLTHTQLQAHNMYKWHAVEPWFAFVSKKA